MERKTLALCLAVLPVARLGLALPEDPAAVAENPGAFSADQRG